ncbi:MAG: PH domain-containing protein [Coriobacteriia bacterium]|nr:PH domain-containing protein [Coriobacteriia bacterium]
MEPGSYRVHHSYVWLGGIKTGLVAALALAATGAGALTPLLTALLDGDLGTGVFLSLLMAVGAAPSAVVLLVGLSVLMCWIAWRHLSYQLTDREFNLYSGVFSKKRLHVPCQRVQSVDLRAGVLQRLVGVCTLEIDTAGGSSNKAILVPYLTKADAQALRAELFRRKRILLGQQSSAAPTPATAGDPTASNLLDEIDGALSSVHGVFDQAEFVDEEPVTYRQGLSNRQLLLAGLSDANGSVGLIIFWTLAFCCSLGLADLVLDGVGAYLDDYLDVGLAAGMTVSDLAWRLAMRAVPYLVGVGVASYVATLAISALVSLVSYGGFQVRRRGSRVEVERGLLQRQTQGVDLDRVQFLRVEQGWIRRLLGYCKVYLGRIDSAADESNKGQADLQMSRGMLVHPYLPVDQLDGFVRSLVPELHFADESAVTVAPPPKARFRAVLRGALWHNGGFWTLAGILVTGAIVMVSLVLAAPEEAVAFLGAVCAFAPFLLLTLIPMAVGVVRGLRWHRGSRLTYGNGFIRLANDGFSRTEVLVPRQKVQFSTLAANPFQRLRDLRSVQVTTAAGSGGTTESLWDLDLEDAESFQEWMRPRR